MAIEFKGYNNISKSDIDGFLVHVYEWDSPSGFITPKYAVSVHLKKPQDINIAVMTWSPDLQSTLSLMDDRVLTGDNTFDQKIFMYGTGGDTVQPVFTDEIKQLMIEDDNLSMDINPEVIVIRRYGEAEKSDMLQNDIDLSLKVAKIVDTLPQYFFKTE